MAVCRGGFTRQPPLPSIRCCSDRTCCQNGTSSERCRRRSRFSRVCRSTAARVTSSLMVVIVCLVLDSTRPYVIQMRSTYALPRRYRMVEAVVPQLELPHTSGRQVPPSPNSAANEERQDALPISNHDPLLHRRRGVYSQRYNIYAAGYDGSAAAAVRLHHHMSGTSSELHDADKRSLSQKRKDSLLWDANVDEAQYVYGYDDVPRPPVKLDMLTEPTDAIKDHWKAHRMHSHVPPSLISLHVDNIVIEHTGSENGAQEQHHGGLAKMRLQKSDTLLVRPRNLPMPPLSMRMVETNVYSASLEGYKSQQHPLSIDTDSPVSIFRQWFVHVKTPVTARMRTSIQRIVHPFHLHAYIAKSSTYVMVAPEWKASEVQRVSGVVGVAEVASALKIDPALRMQLFEREEEEGRDDYDISPGMRVDTNPAATLRLNLIVPPAGAVGLGRMRRSSRAQLEWIASAWQQACTQSVARTHSRQDGKHVFEVSFQVTSHETIVVHSRAISNAGESLSSSTEGLDEASLSVRQFRASLVTWLSIQHPVHWIEAGKVHELHNAHAALIVQSGVAGDASGSAPVWERGLNGSSQVVAIGDTGLDYGNCFFHDPLVAVPVNKGGSSSAHRKIAHYTTFQDPLIPGFRALPGDHDVARGGHGTHLAGTVAGFAQSRSVGSNAVNDLNLHKGVAYGARLGSGVLSLPVGPV